MLSYSGSISSNASGSKNYFTLSNKYIYSTMGSSYKGIRPAISLIPNIELTSGDGTVTNPYVIN